MELQEPAAGEAIRDRVARYDQYGDRGRDAYRCEVGAWRFASRRVAVEGRAAGGRAERRGD